MLEFYRRGVRWPQPSERPFEIAVDSPMRFTADRLQETHIFVRELDAPSLDEVFHQMQADRWPGHAMAVFNADIAAKGLTHVSMSPGDIIENVML